VSRSNDPYIDDNSDSLDELNAERIAADPALPGLIAAARERRSFLRQLAEQRRGLKIPQMQVARAMGTSQAFVSRLETGKVDPQHSTEDRYAAAIGMKVERRLVRG
jgi:DNA-binding XRE family transcriptional regulator